MPKLILKKKAEVLVEYAMKSGSSVCTIGSEAGNDVVVIDRQVSMTHFQIERQASQYFVRDLKSAFGTYVNGGRVNEYTEIHDGDTIQIGEHSLVFRNPLQKDSPPSDDPRGSGVKDFWSDVREAVIDVVQGDGVTDPTATSQTGERFNVVEPSDAERLRRLQQTEEIQIDSLEKELSEVLQQAEPLKQEEPEEKKHEAQKSPYYLLAVYGPYFGKKYQLNFGETKIGRDVRLNDIVLRENRRGEVDPSISRRHATISYRNNSFSLSDKRSKSRTYLNQDMLKETDELLLSPGDEIEIVSDQQSTIFRFVAEGNWDFSFPKRAGAWWLRYRSQALTAGSVAVTLLGLIFALIGWQGRSVATNVPSPFSAEDRPFTKVDISESEKAAVEAPVANGHVPSLPLLADLNGDDYVDLAVTLPNGSLTAFDGKTRRRLWSINTIVLDQSFPASAADLNSNNKADLVALTADAHIVALDGLYGAEIWTSPFFARALAGPPIVGDFDGDGRADVAVVSTDGKLEVGYSRIMNPEWVEINFGIVTHAPLSCADLDRDGDEEILVGTERGLVLIYDGVDRRVAKSVDVNLSLNKLRGSYFEDNRIRHPVGVADVNGDDRADLIISSQRGNLLCIDLSATSSDGKISHRELWWSDLGAQTEFSPEFTFPFSLGDIDGDGLTDVVGVSEAGSVHAYRGLGREGSRQPELWKAPGGEILYQPALFDFDKDWFADVAVVEKNGLLKILSGRNGATLWQGNDIILRPGEMPLLADLNDDTWLDVVVIGADRIVHAFRTNRRVPSATIAWGQRFGGASNLSALDFQEPSAGRHNLIILVSLGAIIAGNLGNYFVRRHRQRYATN